MTISTFKSMEQTKTRRRFLAGAAALPLFWWAASVPAKQVVKDVSELEPGEYLWDPQQSPEGPVAIVVSIPEQLVHVYRNGIRIAVSTCSTGKPGHSTPTGVFTILQKDADHRSSTYNNAPMPNMNRLTWSGIALHAGNLPGYPASHGCIRLPLEFSEQLFTVTHIGTPVIISGSHDDPYELTHPGMVLSLYAEHEMEDAVDALDEKSHPKDWTDGESYPVTTMIASSADKTIALFENSEQIAEGTLTIDGISEFGEHVFVLQGTHDGSSGLAWHVIPHSEEAFFPDDRAQMLIESLRADEFFGETMRQHMHPGMMLIVTDLPTHPERRSGEDFVIMTVASNLRP